MTKTIRILFQWFFSKLPLWIAAGSSVMLGTAMAFGDGVEHFQTGLLCLFWLWLLQIGVSLSYDYKRDKHDLVIAGPLQKIENLASVIPAPQYIQIIILIYLLALLCAIPIGTRGQWPAMIVVGGLSILAILLSWLVHPLKGKPAYHFFSVLFLGPLAVSATYYVQSCEMNSAVVLAGLGIGLFVSALLAVIDLRDYAQDKEDGGASFVVWFGLDFVRIQYVTSLMGAALMPVLIYLYIQDHQSILLCSFISLAAVPNIVDVLRGQAERTFDSCFFTLGYVILIYAILFALGWVF